MILSLVFVLCFGLEIWQHNETLTITNFAYGKTGCLAEEKNYVSKKFKVSVKQLSSSIYFSEDPVHSPQILINDKTFNYSYFGENKSFIKGPADLEVKIYYFKGVKKYLAMRIK
ncbi:hypothetical protein [Flavobacterium aurantiibacter]|nr:hypothetical protein [Flavobacterium aurantiibacter]